MKRILNVKRSTPHVMLYGELGRSPVILTIQNRIINFWSKMLVGKETKLSYRLYKILLSEYEEGRFAYPWISNVKSIFDKVGMSEIWINQNPFNTTWLTKTVQFILSGGRGFEPRPRHTKGVKNGTSGYLAWCSAL